MPGGVARRATRATRAGTRREQQVLPFVEPQSGREVAPRATKGMGLGAARGDEPNAWGKMWEISWERVKKYGKVGHLGRGPGLGTLL